MSTFAVAAAMEPFESPQLEWEEISNYCSRSLCKRYTYTTTDAKREYCVWRGKELIAVRVPSIREARLCAQLDAEKRR